LHNAKRLFALDDANAVQGGFAEMYSCILVPLDGSKAAEKALSHAEGLAKSDGASIHLLMVFAKHPTSGNVTGGGLESDRGVEQASELGRQFEEAQIERAQVYLDDIANRLRGLGFEVETEIGEGSVHEHIVDYAKKHGVDLVVMTNHGHGGIKRFLLGSTTDRVIRTGEVPVLAIP
jgi:nucleotide-binding universal stress UspA family protein